MLRGIARQVKVETRKDPTKQKYPPEIKEILVVLNYTDEQKVCYAAFKMTADAKRWWLSGKLLEEQRFGNMTVEEYEVKFVELSRFAPFLIPNEVRKVRKFKKGLRHRIYELVVGFQVHNFSDLVDNTSVLEKGIQSSTEPAEQKKRPAPSSFQAEAIQRSGKKWKDAVSSRQEIED
ncbi:uncharacterized protein LOC131148309 [Malania oleifera]|uniref:uncharacterized protein LOC131148309 n=1 Tax=Malania oleifera TaxID=397392 RepID=UPI0025AE9516|nr:uncharacterized protein LOC131148309 [Malania oleifera]